MKNIFILLTVIYSISVATVSSGTLHRSDALKVENSFTSTGTPSRNFEVNIAHIAGTTDYYLAWPGISYNDSGDGLMRLGLSVIVVADAISESSWTPTYLFVGFEDTMVRMRTTHVTYFGSHLGGMSDLEAVEYLMGHSVEVDYAF
ncbi:MAG: hypothetical protein KAH31_00370 [Candidatus Sabulitectum sp.]|nr:hypothetical protein [Candidatus Sabulitectum sp.]